MNTKIIFVGNYKGGVGKTTSVFNFADYFSQKNNKVMVLDIDPQSSLSEILVSNNGRSLNELEDQKTLNYVFDLNIAKIKKYRSIDIRFDKSIVQTYKKGNFDFVASSLFYREDFGLDELAVQMEDNIEYLSILKNFIDSILEVKDYDYILVDCPPSNNLITRSAFLLSDYYIIPTILDNVSANGVAHYIKTVNKTYEKYCGNNSQDAIIAKHYFGEKPQLIGVFCTFIRGQVDYKQASADLKKVVSSFAEEEIFFFEEEINNYIDIAKSIAKGETSKVRRDYDILSDSVLKRIAELEQK